MARSVWKGPFVEESLIKKVEKIKKKKNLMNKLVIHVRVWVKIGSLFEITQFI